MDVEVLLYRSDTDIFDISELCGTIEFTDNINKAGICSFPVLKDAQVRPDVGNRVRIRYDGVTWFKGTIVTAEISHEEQIKVKAFDQLFYLKAEDTYVFRDKTASEIFQQLCADAGLRSGTVEDTKLKLGVKPFDGKKRLDIITDCLQLTVIGTRELYYIKDEGGQAVLRNIRSAISSLLIAPDSLMTGYQYQRSIESESYNQIKLVRDNKQTGVRELYITKDSSNIKAWGGTLQYYEKLDDEVTAEQAKERADSLLYLRNRVKQTLAVDNLGEKGIRAGHMLYTRIPVVGLGKFLLCTCAKHSFSNTAHTVKVDLRLV